MCVCVLLDCRLECAWRTWDTLGTGYLAVYSLISFGGNGLRPPVYFLCNPSTRLHKVMLCKHFRFIFG